MKDLKDLTAKFNLLRENKKGIEFQNNDLRALLGSFGFPTTRRFITALSRFDCVIKIGNTRYCRWKFTIEPIHFTRMENVFKEYNRAPEKHVLSEKEAIDLLKSLGYIIKKRVVTYEDV